MYSDNSTEEAVLHSINPKIVKMGAKLKRNISDIVAPAAYEIPARRTFIFYSIHLEASADLVSDLWCISLKIYQATLGVTTQRGVRSDILPLARRYRADRVLSMILLNARFANIYFVLGS